MKRKTVLIIAAAWVGAAVILSATEDRKPAAAPALAGEYGAPITAEKWTANSGGTFEYSYTVQGAAEYLEQINAMFDSRRVPRTQWLAGPGDADNYANGMDNNDGTLKPNANALFDRLGNTVEAYGPTAF